MIGQELMMPLTVTFGALLVIHLLFTFLFKLTKAFHFETFRTLLELLVILGFVVYLGKKYDFLSGLSNSVLFSSSLLVVVLGFAFQTSMEDMIAGVLISIFKPFKREDRITIVDRDISGYVEDITLRHTVVRTFNNSRLIVPNSVMNKSVINNTRFKDNTAVGFLDVTITYDSDIDLARTIMSDIIFNHPDTLDLRTEEQKANGAHKVFIMVRELGDWGIALRANVVTRDIDLNFPACSDIRVEVVKQFEAAGIKIAYPHMVVLDKNI